MKKKLFALIMSGVLFTGMLPSTVLAAGEDSSAVPVGEQEAALDVTVTDADGAAVEGAFVALCTEDGGSYGTAAVGVTEEDGTVTIYAVPGEYTVGVTYVEASGPVVENSYRYTSEESLTLEEDDSVEVVLGDPLVSGPDGDTNGSANGTGDVSYYEHINVIITGTETSASDLTFSALDAVYVYDKYGSQIYHSDDLTQDPDKGSYNCAFDINGTEGVWSIVVSSEDTIVFECEVSETGEDGKPADRTCTISLSSEQSYPEESYYPFADANAWQLCNSMYGSELEESDWETAVAAGEDELEALFQDAMGEEYDESGIPLEGLNYIQAADYLCDTRDDPGQAGLDLVVDVETMSVLFEQEQYDIQIDKTLQDVPDDLAESDLETFTFDLTELVSVTEGDTDSETWSAASGNVAGTAQASTENWEKASDGSWLSTVVFSDFLQCEAEEDTVSCYYILGEEDAETAAARQQYYGIRADVSYSSGNGEAEVVVSCCDLTLSEEDTFTRTSGWSELAGDVIADNEICSSIPFINVYDVAVEEPPATIDISGSKTWVDGDDANGTRPDSITIYLYADGEQTGDTAEVTADDDWAWSFTDLPQYQEDGTTEIVYTIMEGETEGGALVEYIPSYSEDGLNVTNAIPELSKYVSDPDQGEDPGQGFEQDKADNHDTLEYEIRAEHIGNAQNLVFHDLPGSQLDIETLEIRSVTLYESDGASGRALSEGSDYTYTADTCGGADCGMDGCSFEIRIADGDLEGLSADASVVVIFDITLSESVEDFDDAYVAETDNRANISYFSFYAAPVEVKTYSYGFDLYKYDADTDEALEGVEFVLSEEADGGTVYAQFDDGEGAYLLTGWTDSADDATVVVSGSDGKAAVEGLHDGTFSIEETKAPEGYQETADAITVTISADADDQSDASVTATNAEVNGKEVRIANTKSEEGVEELITINGSKTWDDDDDADGIRPESITIRLLADDEEEASVTVTADDDWAWSFADLEKYQEDGTTEITYTIEEDPVDDYETKVSGYDVTNSHTPETPETPEVTGDPDVTSDTGPADTPETTGDPEVISDTGPEDTPEATGDPDITSDTGPADDTPEITGDPEVTGLTGPVEAQLMNIQVSIAWEDDTEGIRPGSVEVKLLANDEESETANLTGDNDWNYTWSDLLIYDDNGDAIQYKVRETVPDGYKVSYGEWQTDEGTYSIVITDTYDAEAAESGSNPSGTVTPLDDDPTQAGGSKTSDMPLPILPIAACAAAAALIVAVLLIRRREHNK